MIRRRGFRVVSKILRLENTTMAQGANSVRSINTILNLTPTLMDDDIH